jgi:hypothetical protein
MTPANSTHDRGRPWDVPDFDGDGGEAGISDDYLLPPGCSPCQLTVGSQSAYTFSPYRIRVRSRPRRPRGSKPLNKCKILRTGVGVRNRPPPSPRWASGRAGESQRFNTLELFINYLRVSRRAECQVNKPKSSHCRESPRRKMPADRKGGGRTRRRSHPLPQCPLPVELR